MRICYILLSPTFGMHQYTADFANRMAGEGHDVFLVTTHHYPEDRYGPNIQVDTPIMSPNTGLSLGVLRIDKIKPVIKTISDLKPDIIHFTGPHLWNTLLIPRLKHLQAHIIHTIHDVDPHEGQQLGQLLRLWNWSVYRSADTILVHGQNYRQALIDRGISADRIWMTPLLHLFLDYQMIKDLEEDNHPITGNERTNYVLFFGRLEAYKGLDTLLTAYSQLEIDEADHLSLIIAGSGDFDKIWPGAFPNKVEVRNWRILDEEAVSLFSNAALIVLPYTSATQSALIGAAYFFNKPVLVADSGALAEYVQRDITGFIIEPGNETQLAQSIEDASKNPQRLRQMGLAGYAWYDQARKDELKSLINMYNSA